jgi:hypothetical protein
MKTGKTENNSFTVKSPEKVKGVKKWKNNSQERKKLEIRENC